MKRVATVFFLVAMVSLVVTSAALAVTKRCEGGVCKGTVKADKLSGTPGFDRIYGGRGKDRIRSGRAADRLYGGAGRDRINAGPGDDRVTGGSGDDRMAGRAGTDRLYGGYGNDIIHGSLDGEKDYFYCGPGRDEVLAGANDFVSRSCETVEINGSR